MCAGDLLWQDLLRPGQAGRMSVASPSKFTLERENRTKQEENCLSKVNLEGWANNSLVNAPAGSP